jgi:ketosteroid isomerase-like protein
MSEHRQSGGNTWSSHAHSIPGICVSGITLFLALTSVTFSASSRSLSDMPFEQQVTDAEGARTNAKRIGDVSRLDQLITSDFIKINRFGRLLGKRQTIALARNPHYATEDVHVRVYGDTAVVSGRESDEGEAAGGVRFLRVWARVDGRWQEWADQGTRITSETEAERLARTPNATARSHDVDDEVRSNHVTEAAEAPDGMARDIRDAERAYRLAERTGDATMLDRFRAPEFVLVDLLGAVLTPPARLPAIRSVVDEDSNVRVRGSVALVVGRVERTKIPGGAMDQFRYSAIWVQGGGRWRIVAEQRTPIT